MIFYSKSYESCKMLFMQVLLFYWFLLVWKVWTLTDCITLLAKAFAFAYQFKLTEYTVVSGGLLQLGDLVTSLLTVGPN